MNFLNDFFFLRPLWLLAIPFSIWLVFKFYTRCFETGNWEGTIDSHLFKFLSTQSRNGKKDITPWIMSIVTSLFLISIAGPVWQKIPQPLLQKSNARVIVLDLSFSMLASDIKPTRIDRVRFKLEDLLNRFVEGETALIGYAGEAFVICPLTDDPANISSLLQGLSPNIMPVQGSRAEDAIELATELLNRASVKKGHIIWITDGILDENITNIENVLGLNKLSILAVGTESGAPISLKGGGFLKNNKGAIVIHKLKIKPLLKLAKRTNGNFSLIRLDDKDINKIIASESFEANFVEDELKRNSDIWKEEGPWLLLIALPISALLFRRGILFSCSLIFLFIITITPKSIQAIDWNDFWLRADQQAIKLFKQGKTKEASKIFENQEWKGTAAYRSGEYEDAIQSFSKIDNPRSNFNLANSLALAGRLQESFNTYEKLLEKYPQHDDAKFNMKLIKKILKERQNKNINAKKHDLNNNKKSNLDNSQSYKQEQKLENDGKNFSEKNTNQISKQFSDSDKNNKEKKDENHFLNRKKAKKNNENNNKEKSKKNTNSIKNQDINDKDQHYKNQAYEQWLRKIIDDPGRLLRNKMKLELKRRGKIQINNEIYW